MKVNLRQIAGPWDQGWVLDKHMLKSVYIGDNEAGHPQFENTRTEVGEATFQLKYRQKWAEAPKLAQVVADSICPKLKNIGFVLPMPASNQRARQPVSEVAKHLGGILKVPVFENVLVKKPTGKSLKDLQAKDAKLAALEGTMVLNDEIANKGRWNVLLIDDLYDSGASMEVATQALRGYEKVGKIYVAALTWK
jgi:predicted amidophosphoribosyltransferase